MRDPWHPLDDVFTALDVLDLAADVRPGVAAALLHVLYGIRSDEALVDHLANNARFQAFVGPGASAWHLDHYRTARALALAGGDRCGLARAVEVVQEAGRWTTAPFTPDDALLEGWFGEHGFKFDDLARLSDRDMQRLLRDIDFRNLALALYGRPPDLCARVAANLSARMWSIVSDEIGFMGPINDRDLREVRGHIAQKARQLIRQRQISAIPEAETL